MAVLAVSEGLDCRNCNEFQKQDRGCLTDSPIPQRWRIGEYSSVRCPRCQVTRQSASYLDAYWLFKSGFLPNGNGWKHETKKFIDAMNIISSEFQRGK